jgi:carboxyl-terminal processing protease
MDRENKTDSVKIVGVVILSVCMLAIGFTAGKLVNFNPSGILSGTASKPLNLNLFWDVWQVMESQFVNADEITEQEKKYGAIKGLVDSYNDPATTFLTPEETDTFESTSEGKYFEGIGAELGYDNEYIIIITPLDGSPAKEAGVRPGDTILSVNGEEISKGDDIYSVVEKIRGEAGTTVTLEVLHKGDSEPTSIEITRGEITVPSMTVEFLDGDIAYLDLARFTDASMPAWVNNWENTTQKIIDNGTKKLILDLRSNPGGFFDAAIHAADDFLPGTEIISIQEDGQGKQKEFRSDKGGDLTDMQVVVLVDAGSASASEILAGALKYNGVAQIVGENTYGKGTAQVIEDFVDGSSLHVTIYKWLLPDGSWINHDNPITPDYEVEFSQDAFKEGQDPQLEKAIQLLK